MNRTKQTIKYIVFDVLASASAWTLFFIFRKVYIESRYYGEVYLAFDYNFYLGVIFIPLFFLLIYYITGYYYEVYRRARLKELAQTFSTSLFGVLIIFFKFILDDIITSYNDYYQSFLFLLSVHFILTYIPRVLITSKTVRKIHTRKIGFPTLLIGSNGQALKVFDEIENEKVSSGNNFVGFISILNEENPKLEEKIPNLGKFEDITKIVTQYDIEEVIIAIESSEHHKIKKVLSSLLVTNVRIKIVSSLYDIITGYSRLITLNKTPFIEVQNRSLSVTQENLKRMIDITLSSIAFLILLPVYIGTAIGVKLSSKGPIFYKQERIGKNGKPFKIIKFRSMYVDAEKHGPALSSDNDSRITPFGKIMRKTRLDEIPQFLNVIVGEMSLVGPRPERQFYIDQIVAKAPFYLNLLKVKPGITSLGQVKYGYAENVEQMIERMKYDLVYVQNMSIYQDFKIMILTVKTVFEASGK